MRLYNCFIFSLFLLSTHLQAQVKTISPVTGVVVAAKTRLPLSGATLYLLRSHKTTIADSNGHFRLFPDIANDTLFVRYIGYADIYLPMEGRESPLIITLKEAAKELDEVIVSTGYQSLRKDRTLGSITHIDNTLFNRSVSTNLLDRIYDIASGLSYSNRATQSTKSSIAIRGVSTIHADDKPLIVLDNFPYDGNLADINPADVESITVLKDAAAASLWGVRSGNGVIIITSKKGMFNQRTGIQFSSNVTFTDKPDLFHLPLISSSDYIALEKDLFEKKYYDGQESSATRPPLSAVVETLIAQRDNLISQEEASARLDALQHIDTRRYIKNYLLQTGIRQQYALNIKGGSAKMNYYGGVGYDANAGTALGDKYKRLTFRLNNCFMPVKDLEISTDIAYTQSRSENNGLEYTSLLASGTKTAPYTALATADGMALAIPYDYRMAYIDTAAAPALLDWHYRPLDEQKYKDNRDNQFDIRFSAGVRYRIIKGLNAEIKYQFQRAITDVRKLYSQQTYFTRNLINQYMTENTRGQLMYPVPLGAILDISNSKLEAWNMRWQLSYQRTSGSHDFSAIAGVESREMALQSYLNDRSYGYDVETNTVTSNIDYSGSYARKPSGSGRIADPYSVSSGVNRYLSYFSNAYYKYKNRYAAYGSARIDYSNFFGVKANQRFVPLWSAGFSWDLHRENFYNWRTVKQLKLRISYGYTGNTNNNATAYTTAKYKGTLPETGAAYALIQSPPNPQLRWERVGMINIGLDFSCQNQWLSGSMEYYKKNGKDLISDILVEATTGVTGFTANAAHMTTQGVDLTLNMRPVSKRFQWDLRFLFSYAINKVTAYERESTVTNYVTSNSFGQSPMVGKPLYSLFTYRWAGLNPTNGDPRGYVADTIADFATVANKSAVSDLYYAGSTRPVLFGSLLQTVEWKRFTLSGNITYKLGYYFRRTSLNYASLLSNWGGHQEFGQRWTKPGDENITNVPSLPAVSTASRDQVYQYSSDMVEKGDHIRLQDIRLGYRMDKHIWKAAPFEQADIFIYVNNPGILWRANKKGIDPEYDATLQSIPTSRSYSIGLNLHF